MPRIELDELVPEEITFAYRGRDYTIDGDIDVDTTFDLIAIFTRLAELDGNDVEGSRQVNKQAEQMLLALFRRHDPQLAELPFGAIGFRHVLGEVLSAIGLQIVSDDVQAPPKPRPATKTSRSRRSTGSRR